MYNTQAFDSDMLGSRNDQLSRTHYKTLDLLKNEKWPEQNNQPETTNVALINTEGSREKVSSFYLETIEIIQKVN